MTSRRLIVLCACAAFAASGGPAAAAPTLGTPVDLTGQPGRIAQGPDGNIWVLLSGATNDIAKITPAGAKTEYDVDLLINAAGLTAGPDGNLWATKPTKVVKIPPADPTTATQTDVPDLAEAQDIVSGPGGNLWAGSGDKLIKITPGAAVATQSFPGVFTGARGIAAGGDGNLWVADFGGDRIASVTPTGTPTYFAVGPGLQGIAAGPGVQVAATQPNGADTNLARVSPGGTALKTKIGTTDPFGIAFGTDGAYWVAQFSGQNLGRLTSTGVYSTPITFPASSGPRRITRGPGNTLWVSLEQSNKVGVVRGVDPIPGEDGGPADKVAPALSAVGLSDATVVVGKAATPLTGTAADKTGTVIRYTLSEAATVRLRIERRLSGRRVKRGKKTVCAKPTRKNRRARRCTRYKLAGTLTRTSKQGSNRVAFSGRIARKALARGRYRLTIAASDAAGNKSKTAQLTFRVVKPKPKPKRKRRR